MTEINALSVSNCRITLRRLAPNASRTPISFCRMAARASSKFATFAHAMSSARPKAINTGTIKGNCLASRFMKLALLFGAEVNAEAERSRELRQGEPAEVELQAPSKG